MTLNRRRVITGGLVALAACSSSGTGASRGGSGSAAGAGSNAAGAAAQEAYAGVLGQAPTTAVKPAADVLAWVVSCGQQVPTCAGPAGAAVTAGGQGRRLGRQAV